MVYVGYDEDQTKGIGHSLLWEWGGDVEKVKTSRKDVEPKDAWSAPEAKAVFSFKMAIRHGITVQTTMDILTTMRPLILTLYV